ncbi:MAG: cold shock domain-containing protein, partial [Stellaceae bacterium]
MEFVDDYSAIFQIASTPLGPRNSSEQQRQRFSSDPPPRLHDDNFEAPRRSFGSAPQFGGPRFEAPSGPPVQGVVKWYNPEKGFGFVELADGSGDAFLHVSVVERSGNDT